MIREKTKALLAAILAAALLAGCRSGEEKAFTMLREKAENKSGVKYRTTYFVSGENISEGFPYALEKDGKFCFAFKDQNGKETRLTPAIFTDVRDSYGVELTEEDAYAGKYLAPAEYEGKWGYVLLDTAAPDEENVTWHIEPKYDNAECFTEQAAAVCLNALYGVIDENGSYLLAPYYDEIKYRSFTYMPALKDGEWYFIDIDGRRVFGPFEDAESYEYGFAAVKKGGKWGYIDKSGYDATVFEYDEAYSVESDGCAWVKNGNKWEKVRVR